MTFISGDIGETIILQWQLGKKPNTRFLLESIKLLTV
jgi:hypothetical protein